MYDPHEHMKNFKPLKTRYTHRLESLSARARPENSSVQKIITQKAREDMVQR